MDSSLNTAYKPFYLEGFETAQFLPTFKFLVFILRLGPKVRLCYYFYIKLFQNHIIQIHVKVTKSIHNNISKTSN